VILGANIGTTSTGWLVSMFGLKMSILPVAMPLVGIGALMRMLARGRVAAVGHAVAGFGLIFVGIATLQQGMADVAQFVDPSTFPPATLWGRGLLLLLGIAMTVVMQSSSAAVATTLAAVSTGAIDIAQAAALVVGQNVGTTVTAALASIGASVGAKRTALAHVLFNLLAGVIGFVMVPLFAWYVARTQGDPTGADAAVSLAAFHTVMNVAGVAVLFPFTRRFAALVERLVVDRGPRFTKHLDTSVTRIASVAIEAARRTLQEVLAWTATTVGATARDGSGTETAAAAAALAEVRRFLAQVRAEHESEQAHHRHVDTLHAIDHLEQLVELSAAVRLQRLAASDTSLQELRGLMIESAALALQWCESPAPGIGESTGQLAATLARGVQGRRPQVLTEAADGGIGTDEALDRLDSMRWMENVAYHLHRALAHLGADNSAALQ
jgi:phosphate:Na+ symporter